MSSLLNRLNRLICRRQGHVNAATMLPEDGWGLYAFSRMYCNRCGRTEAERYPFDELARYNSERRRGIVHEPAFVARMAIQQEYFDEQAASPTPSDTGMGRT